MKKINFEAGTQVSPAKVTINNVDHNVTPAVWEGNTPLSPFVLNKMQDNIEEETKTIQTTEVSEELTIENCAGVKGKLDIKSGKSIQEGEPSPDYPSRIRNVGEDGSADFKITGKNKLKITSFVNRTTDGVTFTAKFDKKGNLEYINAVGNSTTGYRDIMRVDISNLPAGKYKINGLGTDKVIRYVLLKGNNDEPKIITTNTDVEFTQDSASPYLHFRIDLYMAGEVNATIKPMIRPSIITDNTYEPYQEQIKSFPFAEGQVLHKGDYLASNGTHHKRKTLVLDGTETITEVSNNRFQIALPLKAGDGYQKIISLCSHFKSITQLEIISTTNNNVVAVNGNYVYFRVNSEETLDNFKNRLATQYANGTPVIVEYELAEEIVIPYTTEQEEAYYELQHLLMYEGYTKIECIDEIKPDIQGTYYFNNELNNMYISRIDSLEEKIRLLEKAVSSQTSEVSE